MKRYYNWTSLRRFSWQLKRSQISVGKKTRLAPGARLLVESGGRIKIGRNCRIHHGAIIDTQGGDIVIGDNVSLNPYSIILGRGGVQIGNDTRIAAHTVIVAANHVFDDPELPIRHQPMVAEGVNIGRDVWIGAGVKILDGCDVGDRCVIGAGAVVSRSTAPASVNVGVPARQISTRGACADELRLVA